jgi:hypothetical protein
MADYFLLLKLIMVLNQDTVDGAGAGRDDFITSLTDDEAASLPAQVAAVGKEAGRLLAWRKWKAENRQPGLVIVKSTKSPNE